MSKLSENKQEPIINQAQGNQGAKADSRIPPYISLPPTLSVKQLADLLQVSAIEVIKQLMRNGVMANINQAVDFDTAAVVADHFGYKSKRQPVFAQVKRPVLTGSGKLSPRPPVITIIGHVDHGKNK